MDRRRRTSFLQGEIEGTFFFFGRKTKEKSRTASDFRQSMGGLSRSRSAAGGHSTPERIITRPAVLVVMNRHEPAIRAETGGMTCGDAAIATCCGQRRRTDAGSPQNPSKTRSAGTAARPRSRFHRQSATPSEFRRSTAEWPRRVLP